MLTDSGILARRARYLCCSLDFLSAAIDARIHGDRKCYEENRRKWLWMSWAADVMQDTPVGDEDGCTLLPFATDVADKADCLCDICGCPAPTASCAITPDYTVLEALAFADLPVDPAVDSEYYVISGSTLGLGMIATWNGATYDYTSIPNGSIVWATVTNDYWTNTGGGPEPYFPVPLLTNISPDLWWADQDPDITAQGRDIQLQALGTSGWYNVAPVTNEADLPQQVNLTGLPVTDPNGIRWNYIVGDCTYPSTGGSFEPPINPPVPCSIIPAWTVDQNADANQEFTLLAGTYLILTNNFDVVNGWSGHVGEVVFPDGSFAVPPVGATIWNVQEGVYWFLFGSGWAPLFPPVIITPDLSGTAFIESAYPAATAENDRQVIVTATSPGGSVFVLWSGTEQDLPVTVPAVGIEAPASVIYIGDDGCVNTAPAEVGEIEESDTIICGDGIEYGMWTYPGPSNTPFGILFTVTPLFETLTMTFAGGTITDEITVLFYDGIGGAQIGSISSPTTNAQGFQIISPGPELYVVFGVADGAPVPQPQPFWWQIVCTQGSSPLAVSAASVDDCDEWEFNVDVNVAGTGDGPSITLEVMLDGVPQPDVTGVGIGVTSLGPYPIGSEVIINAVDLTNPDNSILMGAYYGGDTCLPIEDPCSPEVGYKVNGLGDLADLPVDPGLPAYGYFVLSDTSGIGTWPVGSLLGWDDGTGTWFSVGYTPGIIISDGITFWIAQGPGFQPYNVFPTPVLNPTGILPNNWTLWIEDIGVYNITTNRPISLETRSGFGPWTQRWTGTEQQLVQPTSISITGSFTQARIIWNYDTCGFVGGVIIEALPWEQPP